jgi:hypothetical protein
MDPWGMFCNIIANQPLTSHKLAYDLLARLVFHKVGTYRVIVTFGRPN